MLPEVVCDAGAARFVRATTLGRSTRPLVAGDRTGQCCFGVACLTNDANGCWPGARSPRWGLAVRCRCGRLLRPQPGLARASPLFVGRHFPRRRLEILDRTLCRAGLVPLKLAALSIAGCPLLVGFLAKESLLQTLPAPVPVVTSLAVGHGGRLRQALGGGPC